MADLLHLFFHSIGKETNVKILYDLLKFNFRGYFSSVHAETGKEELSLRGGTKIIEIIQCRRVMRRACFLKRLWKFHMFMPSS